MSADTIPRFTLGDRLAKARELVGISVQEMADRLRVSRTTISNYEHDRTEPPFSTVERYAQMTGVPIWWLEATDTDPSDPAEQVNPGTGCYRENVIDVYFGASRQTQAAA